MMNFDRSEFITLLIRDSLHDLHSDSPPYAFYSLLRQADLQLRQEELCWNDNVVEDDQLSAETVGGAELRQLQMQLVHTRRQRDRGRTEQICKNVEQIF